MLDLLPGEDGERDVGQLFSPGAAVVAAGRGGGGGRQRQRQAMQRAGRVGSRRSTATLSPSADFGATWPRRSRRPGKKVGPLTEYPDCRFEKAEHGRTLVWEMYGGPTKDGVTTSGWRLHVPTIAGYRDRNFSARGGTHAVPAGVGRGARPGDQGGGAQKPAQGHPDRQSVLAASADEPRLRRARARACARACARAWARAAGLGRHLVLGSDELRSGRRVVLRRSRFGRAVPFIEGHGAAQLESRQAEEAHAAASFSSGARRH